jgi:hypothetical protein
MDIYEPVIAEMKAQIEECQRVIVTLEMMQAKGTGVAASAGKSTAAQSATSFSNDSFFGMTIADGAKKYLTAVKKTAPAKIVADALVAGGFKTSAKNFVETVRSILSRNPSFAFINGEFGLAEWYPGRKVTKRPGAVVPVSAEEEEPDYESMREALEEDATLQRA